MRYTEMRSITFYNTYLLAFSLCLYVTSILSTGIVKFVWRCVRQLSWRNNDNHYYIVFVSDHVRISLCHTHAAEVHQQLSVR